jgi:hypothetical protein
VKSSQFIFHLTFFCFSLWCSGAGGLGSHQVYTPVREENESRCRGSLSASTRWSGGLGV